MAELLGALLITYILTRAVNSIAKKKTNSTKAAFIAFLVVAVIALLVTSVTMGIGKGFLIYVPCLVLWLIIYLVRTRRTSGRGQPVPRLKEQASTPKIEPPKTLACPYCGAEYNPKDYRQDSTEWVCSHCAKPLPKE